MRELILPDNELKTEGLARIRVLIKTNADKQELIKVINYEKQNVKKQLEFNRKPPKYPKPNVIERRKKAIQKFEKIEKYLKTLEKKLEE